MNIYYIAYENIDYGGRTLELIKVMSKIGDVYGIVLGTNDISFAKKLSVASPNTTYKQFILMALKLYNKTNTDVLFVDNRKAALIANIIMTFKRPKKIIYDMRELRIISEIKSVSSKLGCIPENRIIKKANLVVCASEERAQYVKSYFTVKKVTFYENIRRLEYSSNYNEQTFQLKYKELFDSNSFKIVSTSGTSIARGNLKLIEAILNIKEPIDVYLIGGAGMEIDSDKIIKKFITEHDMHNVHLIDMVKQDELKYLISLCDCGVVNYHSNDTNNKYCASGKVYEFIFEGKPVITTSNPPLERLTREHGIGCSGEDYYNLIIDMITNYNNYKEHVKSLRNKISVEKNNDLLVDAINSVINM